MDSIGWDLLKVMMEKIILLIFQMLEAMRYMSR